MTESKSEQTNFKNDRKVRLVVKKYDNFKQIPKFKWKSNNNDWKRLQVLKF